MIESAFLEAEVHTHPITVYERGLYFDGLQNYLKYEINLHHTFAVEMWVKPTVDNSRNFFAGDGFLFSTEEGALTFTLAENTAVWTSMDERW